MSMYFEFTAIAQQHTGSLKQHLRANARLKSCLFFRMHIYTELGYVHGKTETGMEIVYPSMNEKKKKKRQYNAKVQPGYSKDS